MSPLLRKAEEILEVAVAGASAPGETAIVIHRQGGLRMLNPAGWSISALAAEYGAAAVYKVERRGATVRVEGWDGSERCLLQRMVIGCKRMNPLAYVMMGGSISA